MRIYQIIYMSRAAGGAASEEDQRAILETARKRNLANDITGLLLYHDGAFLQLLEGPEMAVLRTYTSIVGDRRHKNLRILYAGETDARLFPNWAMEVASLEDWHQPIPEGVYVTLKRAESPVPENEGANAQEPINWIRIFRSNVQQTSS